MDLKSKIILISGPTASGKSKFAIQLAKKINGEVINADSMQIYKELKILTARPKLKDIKILEQWAGLIDVTPDAVPVISPVSKLPGFYLATGFSGHGFGLGPAAGELASGMITGSAAKSELEPFALNRFF